MCLDTLVPSYAGQSIYLFITFSYTNDIGEGKIEYRTLDAEITILNLLS